MNKILVGSLLLACLLGITFSKENKVDWDIYHTGDQIAEEMENLRDNCGNRLQLTNVGSDPSLKVARLNAGQTRENKAFLVFGEHPRELISSETGLRLLQKLC